MNTNSDMEAVLQKLEAEDRAHLGGPPSAEELERYTRGELSAEEESRVRALLVAYPEVASVLTRPFPEDASMPDEELSRAWAALQPRLSRREAEVVPFRRHVWTAIAAALALVFGGLYVHEASRSRAIVNEPRMLGGENLLLPDGRRGAAEEPATLAGTSDAYLLSISIVPTARYRSYEVAIQDKSGKTLWSGNTSAGEDDVLLIAVPRAFLPVGRYQAVVDGVGERRERVATYSFRVAR